MKNSKGDIDLSFGGWHGFVKGKEYYGIIVISLDLETLCFLANSFLRPVECSITSKGIGCKNPKNAKLGYIYIFKEEGYI